MTAGIAPVTARPAWKGLEAHHEKVRDLHLRTLFENDPKRGERLTAEAVGLYLDYSKNRVTDETLDLLLQLAEESGLRARIDAMFGGEKINITENRAVLHAALRAPRETSIVVDPADAKGIAGRDASGKVLNVLAQSIPWFLGGSADLGPSNKTTLTYEGAGSFQAGNPGGKNLHFGVREHAMAAIVNGLSLSKLRAFGATFFIFSDYARPAIRLSALMELPSIFVFTHDALGDGEDGPTHQPVEHLASLRAIPGLVTLRPGDANEVVEAYRYALQLHHQPAVLVLSRQPLPTLDRRAYAPATGVARGASVLADARGETPRSSSSPRAAS